ncbi:hypothetical protein JCM1393_10010 [Clostridium carnis]
MNIYDLTPKQLIIWSSIVSVILSENLTANQQNILGNFLCGVGQNILTFNAVITSVPSNTNSENN